MVSAKADEARKREKERSRRAGDSLLQLNFNECEFITYRNIFPHYKCDINCLCFASHRRRNAIVVAGAVVIAAENGHVWHTCGKQRSLSWQGQQSKREKNTKNATKQSELVNGAVDKLTERRQSARMPSIKDLSVRTKTRPHICQRLLAKTMRKCKQ